MTATDATQAQLPTILGLPGPCDVLPGVIGDGCDTITGLPGEVLSPVTDAAGDVIGNSLGNLAEQAIEAIAGAVFGFCVAILELLWELINGTTVPDVTDDYVLEWASMMGAIALTLTVGFVCLQIITDLVRFRSLASLGKTMAMAGAAVLGTVVSLPIIAALVAGVDALAEDLVVVTFGDLDQMGDDLSSSLSAWMSSSDGFATTTFASAVTPLAGPAGAALGGIVMGILVVIGAFIVWFALLIRSLLLEVFVVTAPIAIMGLAWDYTRGWFKKWAACVTALIFTKLGIMIVFGLGVSALKAVSFSDPDGAGQAFGQLMTGALMMALAAFVPFACFKFFDFLGEQAIAGHHMSAASAPSAAQGALQAPMKGVDAVKQLMNSDGGGGPTAPGPQSNGETDTKGTGNKPEAPKPPPTPTGDGGASAGAGAAGGGAAAAGPAAAVVAGASATKDGASAARSALDRAASDHGA